MYAVENYTPIREANDREIKVQISIGTGVDNTVADDISSVEGDFLPMSDTSQLVDSLYVIDDSWATFEGDGIGTALRFGNVAPPIEETAQSETGVWSGGISDSQGYLQWSLTVRIAIPHTSAFTIYSNGPTVVSGSIEYILNNETVRTFSIANASNIIMDNTITEYDTIVINVTRISEPYKHFRIAELEFGASVTISNEELGSSVRLVSEFDPSGMSMPLDELDFALVNVQGEYDEDNPESRISNFVKYSPVQISVTTVVGNRELTVPMGKFYVTDCIADETQVNISAQDVRCILQSVTRPIVLETGVSVGLAIQNVLTQLDVQFIIEDEVYALFPDADYTFASDLDVLTQMLYLQQYYGVRMVSARDGFLYINLESGDVTTEDIGSDLVISYPRQTTTMSYNYISVKYGNQYLDVDLRNDISEARAVLTVANPLVHDADKAYEVAVKVMNGLYSQQYETSVIGDPILDVGDAVHIAGRFSEDNPNWYRNTMVEQDFDGALTTILHGVAKKSLTARNNVATMMQGTTPTIRLNLPNGVSYENLTAFTINFVKNQQVIATITDQTEGVTTGDNYIEFTISASGTESLPVGLIVLQVQATLTGGTVIAFNNLPIINLEKYTAET